MEHKKLKENEIETVFEVSFGKEFSYFGTNRLIRKIHKINRDGQS